MWSQRSCHCFRQVVLLLALLVPPSGRLPVHGSPNFKGKINVARSSIRSKKGGWQGRERNGTTPASIADRQDSHGESNDPQKLPITTWRWEHIDILTHPWKLSWQLPAHPTLKPQNGNLWRTNCGSAGS
jgi:hypothetical protein